MCDLTHRPDKAKHVHYLIYLMERTVSVTIKAR